MAFDQLVRLVARGVEAVGVAVLVLGIAIASVGFLRRMLRHGALASAFDAYRTGIGRSILLGLEFLLAADIIATITVEPTFRRLGVLAVIVLIRTFLSFALEVELTGRWPWRRGREPARDDGA